MSSPGHGVVWPGTEGTFKDIWCCWCVVVIIALLWIMHTSVKRNMSHCVSLHPHPRPTLFFISLLLISYFSWSVDFFFIISLCPFILLLCYFRYYSIYLLEMYFVFVFERYFFLGMEFKVGSYFLSAFWRPFYYHLASTVSVEKSVLSHIFVYYECNKPLFSYCSEAFFLYFGS